MPRSAPVSLHLRRSVPATMARLATIAVLLLSLLAVASCRVLETISDDQGPPNPVLPTHQDDQTDGAAEVSLPALPTPAVAVDESVLRLPSHRRPCHLHRHLWWVRHHGLSHHRGGFSGPGEARVHPAVDVVPTELARGEEQEPREAELEAVAEPDPDSRPDTQAAQKPFHGEEEGEEAKAWKVEMLRRFRHGIRFHHRHHLRHHHEQDGEEHDDHEQDKDEGTDMKLFQRFHRHHAHDSDNEADEVEELARRLSEAIMRRSFNHVGHHHHHHHHGAEGGVKKWFKGLLGRF